MKVMLVHVTVNDLGLYPRPPFKKGPLLARRYYLVLELDIRKVRPVQ
jgi:hypothetical protein